MLRHVLLTIACILLASRSLAQVDVAVLAADYAGCYENDAVDKLQATGLFASVDFIDVGSVTPTLQQLSSYDAVLTYSNGPHYMDAAALGDVLADYVDAGGGVVTATFANVIGLQLEGRWTQGYEVVVPSSQQQGSHEFLGVVHQPGHPVMAGVTVFDGGWNGSTGSYRPTGSTLSPGSILIADWTDGIPLVVQGANPRRIDLGFFPVSNACHTSFWVLGTDGDLIMANALLFVAAIYERYCTPGQPNSTGVPACMSAAGSRFVAANDVTLVAEDLPPGQFGYFLVGSNQGQFMPPGSMGVICLACSGFQGCAGIGRYNQIGQIIAGPTGSLAIDLGALPLFPPMAVQAGETWNFQCWYRDLGSSNFTDAISISFL